MIFLKKITTSPVFDDEAKTREAKLLNMIILGGVITPIPYVIYIIAKEPEFMQRTFVQVASIEVANILLLWLLHRGKVQMALVLHVSLLWLFFTVTAVTGEGVNGKAYLLGYPLVIFIAGALLGTRGALIATCITLFSGGGMVFAQEQGWIEISPLTTPTAIWVISMAIFPVLALLQYLTGRELRDALSRAHTSEGRYRLISEVSSDYTFSTEFDPAGNMRLSWVAGAFEKITGYTFEEYVTIGGWLTRLHPDDAEKNAESVVTIRNNKPVTTEVRTIKKNGDLVWVRVYAHPVWDKKQNRVTGMVGAVQDITERKQSEEALAQEHDLMQIFMDNIPDHIYLKDSESRFIRINKAQANFLKLNSPQDAIGKTDLDFFAPDLAHQFLEEEKQILISGQPIINRVEFNPTKGGTPRWLAATKAPVRDSSGKLIGTIGISRDITQQKTIEAMLAYQRDTLQIFLDNIPGQVYFKDSESRFVRINQGQAHFLGIDDPQDAVGKTDLDFQSPELARKFLAEEKQIMETGQPVLSRIEFNPAKDGKPRWLSRSKVPAKNESGQIIGIIGISIDVTEQKLAEESEQRRRIMLEKIVKLGQYVTEVQDIRTTLQRIWHTVRNELDFDRLGIFLYDPENNTMNGTYGTDNEGKMVEEWNICFPLTEENFQTIAFIKTLQEPNGLYITHNYGVEHGISEGDIMYGVRDYAAVAVWSGNKPVAIICVDQLLTQRLISDYQLEMLRLFAGYAGLAISNAHLNDALENELTQRQTFIDELETKNAELERFTYTVSHDLKSPLVTITGFLGYLEKDALTGDKDKIRNNINRISGAAEKMQALLNDLLELSRIGRLMNPPEHIPFEEIVNEAVDHVQGRLNEKNVLLKFQKGLTTIYGDRARLVEVMQNLIDNAAKYSDPNKQPIIEIGTVEEQDKIICFVRDNGVGIDPQFHERVFGLFNKLNPNSEGTGIGLSLIKRIIEAHNGQIWVESDTGKGATFYFTLPKA